MLHHGVTKHLGAGLEDAQFNCVLYSYHIQPSCQSSLPCSWKLKWESPRSEKIKLIIWLLLCTVYMDTKVTFEPRVLITYFDMSNSWFDRYLTQSRENTSSVRPTTDVVVHVQLALTTRGVCGYIVRLMDCYGREQTSPPHLGMERGLPRLLTSALARHTSNG